MASQINSSNIDGNYPVAGRDNNSSGFRTNFTNIKNNFTYAQTEITDLQNKGIFKANLIGNNAPLVSVNDMLGAPLRNAEILGFRETIYDLGSVSGSQDIDFIKGSYQTITLAGSLSIGTINNWPSSGVQTRMRLQITVPNANYTLAFPASVSQNINSIGGITGGVIYFSATGVYIFELSSNDGGTTIDIQDLSRNRNTFQGNVTVTELVNNVTVNGVTITVSNIGGQVVGNVYANNIIATSQITTGNSITLTGNLTAANVIATANIYGTIMTPVQSNITLLGNLSSLSVTGNANIGNIAITGLTDMCGGTSYGIHYIDIANGGSATIYSNVGVAIVNFTSNIAGCALTMPTTPSNGQIIKIGFTNNTCSTLTHVASGQTLLAPLTTANQYAGGQWVYHTVSTTWHKVS